MAACPNLFSTGPLPFPNDGTQTTGARSRRGTHYYSTSTKSGKATPLLAPLHRLRRDRPRRRLRSLPSHPSTAVLAFEFRGARLLLPPREQDEIAVRITHDEGASAPRLRLEDLVKLHARSLKFQEERLCLFEDDRRREQMFSLLKLRTDRRVDRAGAGSIGRHRGIPARKTVARHGGRRPRTPASSCKSRTSPRYRRQRAEARPRAAWVSIRSRHVHLAWLGLDLNHRARAGSTSFASPCRISFCAGTALDGVSVHHPPHR